MGRGTYLDSTYLAAGLRLAICRDPRHRQGGTALHVDLLVGTGDPAAVLSITVLYQARIGFLYLLGCGRRSDGHMLNINVCRFQTIRSGLDFVSDN